MSRSTPDKKTLRRFYEREASAMNHQELMYSKAQKNEVWWHTKRFRFMSRFIEETVGDGNAFIDVGCAEGYYVKYTLDRFKRSFGVGADIARNYITKAKKNLKEKDVAFVICDAENLPFRECSFDVALCSEVLEHIFNYRRALDEIMRIADRCIIISFPGHTIFHKLLTGLGLLPQLVRRIAPPAGHSSPVGHLSDITIPHVRSYLEASNKVKLENLLVGGAFPVQVYRLVPSAKLIDAIDNVACSILSSLSLAEHTTIHVMKMAKKAARSPYNKSPVDMRNWRGA